jgi:hypothetical protein
MGVMVASSPELGLPAWSSTRILKLRTRLNPKATRVDVSTIIGHELGELTEAAKAQAIELAGIAAAKSRLDLASPLPARIPSETKEAVLKLIDEAVAAGAPHAWACRLLGLPDDRAHRWRHRLRQVGTLEDLAAGSGRRARADAVGGAGDLGGDEPWREVDRSIASSPTGAPTPVEFGPL